MMKLLLKIFLLAAVCLFAVGAYAETYWVDDNGSQTSLDNCKGVTPLSGASACLYSSVDYDGSTIIAGDTVYFRTGTYTFSANAIDPVNSGTDGEDVIFQQSSNLTIECVDLQDGEDYITVRGITCNGWYHHLHIEGSSGNYANYNEIDSCTFSDMYSEDTIDWRGSTIENYATYNWIHDSTFEKYGRFKNANDEAVVFELGHDSSSRDVSYNVIEDTTLQYGGHHVLGIAGYRNIIRNNYIQSNNWSAWDEYTDAAKVIQIMDQAVSTQGQHLLEGNRIAFGTNPHDEDLKSEGEGILFSGHYNILRYNVFDNHDQEAIMNHNHGSGTANYDNFLYNNTFWNNGYDICSWCQPNVMFKSMSHPLYDAPGGAAKTNRYKNNLAYNNANTENSDVSFVSACDSCTSSNWYPADNTYANNYEGGVEGNPNFVNIVGTPDSDNATQFDFNLQPGSGAIDGGGHLTLVDEATGSGTAFNVDDALYFQDGWGNGAGGGAVVNADWICVGTVNNCIQISSIDYPNNKITVVSPISWSDNDNVWLYKDSSGDIVLYGSAPDQGAYEYEPQGTIRGVTIQ
jgi:hypothetical protein